MIIRITLPAQVVFPTALTTYVCKGYNGTDNPNLLCTINRSLRQITIQNAFNKTFAAPSFVNISVASLQNPSTAITTDSFVIETYTYFNTRKLDLISQQLTVTFNCSTNCKTCTGSKQQCSSCQGLLPEKYLDNSQCKKTCPLTSFASTLNVCSTCKSPCVTCSGSASNCTSCVSGYALSGNTCTNNSLYFTKYYYYFSALGGILTVFVLLIKLCAKKTNFVQSTISLIALPEILGWCCLFYLYLNQTTIFHIIILGSAVGIHFILNVIYGLTHQRLILTESNARYKKLILDNHCWSTFSIVMAFLLNFKFHLIQMSDFAGSEALSGDWSHEIWNIWNMISVTYMLSCYSIFAGGAIYFGLSHMDRKDEWIWNATFDLALLSTYVFILLLIATCRHCADHAQTKDPSEIDVQSGNPYDKLDKNGSAFLEEALSKFPKPKPPPLNMKGLDKFPTTPGGRRRLNTFEKDSMTEEEIIASSARNRQTPGALQKKRDSFSLPTENLNNNSGRKLPQSR